MSISEAAIEAAVHARGRANNSKWDDPIFGYENFSADQWEYLRDTARVALEAAAPHMLAEAWEAGANAAWQRSTPMVNGQSYQWRHAGDPVNPYGGADV
jgi:hypothetical protein